MPISWQIGFIVIDVDPGIVEPRGELAREGVMHFKLAHALILQHLRDFFVKAVDIPLGRTQVGLLRDSSCGFLGSKSRKILCALL